MLNQTRCLLTPIGIPGGHAFSWMKYFLYSLSRRSSSLALPLAMFLPCASSQAVEIEPGSARPIKPEFQVVAVENAGLWPNLALAGSSLLLVAFNEPNTGNAAGGMDAWVSNDEGQTWTLKGKVAPQPDANSNRMNCALGTTDASGRLMAIVGGFADPSRKRTPLSPIITSSADGGATWSEPVNFTTDLFPAEAVVPYGRIVAGADGSLRTAFVHYPDYPAMTKSAVYMVASRDGGKTWNETSKVADDITEASLAEVAPKEWLALARTRPAAAVTKGEIRQYRTKDDGATWQDEGLVTKPLGIPPNLTRLKDGRLLLTYSERSFGGIHAQVSDDGGNSWNRPFSVSSYKGDGGYPSSIETPDGSIITAYYSKKSPALGEGQEKFHTAVVKWHLP